MQALIDGDIILYSVGFASERRYYQCSDGFMCVTAKQAKAHCIEQTESIGTALTYELQCDPCHPKIWKGNANALLKSIVDATGADSYLLYFTGKGNFRADIYSEYKANRKGVAKPLCHAELFEWLQQRHPSEVVDGIEADDALGINQASSTCICTLDKDLDMIKGKHYNWRKKEKYRVTQKDADKHFWIQLLTGDMTDNIIGLKGIGPVKAQRVLDECQSNEQMLRVCQYMYEEHERTDEDLELNATLLWIQRSVGSEWKDLVSNVYEAD